MSHLSSFLSLAFLFSYGAHANAQSPVVVWETESSAFNNTLNSGAGHFETVLRSQGLGLVYGFDLSSSSYDWWTTTPGNWELDNIAVTLALGGLNTQNVTVSAWIGGQKSSDPFPTTFLSDVTPATQSVAGGGSVAAYTFTLPVTGLLRSDTAPFSGTGAEDYIWFVIQGSDTDPNAQLVGQAVTTGSAVPLWSDNTFGTGWSPSPLIWKGESNIGTSTFTEWGSSYWGGGVELIGKVQLNFVPVPEPSGAMLLGLGGLAALVRRRR